jgi:hypothetical protein
MTKKPAPLRKSAAPKRKRRKETPAEQHKRFLAMADEIGASEKPEDFERAFARIVKSPSR